MANVPYHVSIYTSGPRTKGASYYFRNLDEEQLKARVVDQWDAGEPISWSGRTAPSDEIETIHVFRTADAIPPEVTDDRVYALFTAGEDVTNEVIEGPAGRRPRSAAGATPASPLRDPRRVMVVHGRNKKAADAMFMFLRALGLHPIEWEQAVKQTGQASPHNLDAVRAAMGVGQAVVVLLTAEDRAGLLPTLAENPDDDDVALRGQPRQNVILEAGLAMGVDRTRTVLVELGDIRRASDFDGLNTIRLSNLPETRDGLRMRLETAGCDVSRAGTDWTRPEVAGDFDASVAPWEPEGSGGRQYSKFPRAQSDRYVDADTGKRSPGAPQ